MLDYTIIDEYENDKGENEAKTITALKNFRQFYMNLLSHSIEGDIDVDVFEHNMGMLPDDYIKTHECDASLSFRATDLAKNTNLYTFPTSADEKASELQYWQSNNLRDIVIRFYRYSGSKVMITVELVDTYDANGNPIPDASKTVGVFYVLDNVLNRLQEDLDVLLNGEKVLPVGEAYK